MDKALTKLNAIKISDRKADPVLQIKFAAFGIDALSNQPKQVDHVSRTRKRSVLRIRLARL